MNRSRIIYLIFTMSIAIFIFAYVNRHSSQISPVGSIVDRYDKSVITTIKVSNSELNVGKITVDEAHTARTYAVLHNTGNNNLYIDRVEVSCQCTSGDIPKRAVVPGDSIAIEIAYNKTMPGFFYSDVIIHGNFEDSPALLSFEGQLVY